MKMPAWRTIGTGALITIVDYEPQSMHHSTIRFKNLRAAQNDAMAGAVACRFNPLEHLMPQPF